MAQPDINVEKFGLLHARSALVNADDWKTLQFSLINAYRRNPSLVSLLAETCLLRQVAHGDVEVEILTEFIENRIPAMARANRTGEIIWLLFLAIRLGLTLSAHRLTPLFSIENAFVAPLVVCLDVRGLVQGNVDLPIGMHFPGLCAKMHCGLRSAAGADIMIPAIIVGGHLAGAVAVADRPPVVNFEQTCREETTGKMRTNDKFEVCIADEKRARDQLAAQWSSFDPAARTRCARASTSGHAASYLELLVCLELDQADREVHGLGSTTGITITEPGRPAGERDEATDSSQGRPAPVAVPSRPAPISRSLQQPVARSAVGPPAAPPPAAPLPISPSPPMSEPQPTSQAEVLQQSLCRSPLGYVLPGCR